MIYVHCFPILLFSFLMATDVLQSIQGVRVLQKEPVHPSELTKITHGMDASIKQFPFIVSIQEKEKHTCGGSLLLPDWVLTAAHCVWIALKNPEDFRLRQVSEIQVVAGMTTVLAHPEAHQGGEDTDELVRPPSTSVRDVSEIHPYSHYNTMSTLNDDIALLKLSSKFVLSDSILTIRLPRTPYTLDVLQDMTVCHVIGWGKQFGTRRRRHYNREQPSTGSEEEDVVVSSLRGRRGAPKNRHLKYRIGLLINHEQCLKLLPNFSTERQLCIDFADKGTSCQGDSGGPFICGGYPEGYLVGLVSGGIQYDPECKGYPVAEHVYTRIDFYLDWIYSTIGPKQFRL